ncbi:MAG: branched-chain amino acid ABC transporter permease [Tissierellales bacterium]
MKILGRDMNKKKAISLLVLFVILLIVPKFSSYTTLSLFTRIFILSVYAMSYDILRGYTGFINLGHAIFFGGGAYIGGILFKQIKPSMPVFILAILVTILYSSIGAYLMGKISLRKGGSVLTATMITLALGEIVRNTAEKWRSVTNGSDGLTFNIPEFFQDRYLYYYIALFFLIIMAIILKKFIMSPSGRVLLAIRENEQRAEFLGFDTEKFKLISLQVAGIAGGLSGIIFGIFNRFANTELLSTNQTINALLYTLVGGTGTLYGGIVGTTIVTLFQNFLLNLRSIHPIFERWLIFSGALYVAVVLFMPKGIVGLWLHYFQNRAKKVKEALKMESNPSE